MNEAEARRVLLVRAFETPPAAPWSEADAAWASREALQSLGEQAPPQALLAQRAALASARLGEREPAIAHVLSASQGRASLVWAFLLLAVLAGLALDAVGSGERINILAPPFAALIAWNVAVYAVLAARALRRHRPEARTSPPAGSVQRAIAGWTHALAGRVARRRKLPALAAFARDWALLGSPLHTQRVACILHGAAVAIAIGALASLYLRGLAFEYRAGWDSTFLSVEQVHRVLSVALWPALQLTGQALPDTEQLAALRFSLGGGGNAARWIHLIAVTVGLFVLLPRALLAGWAGWRAHHLAEHFPLSLDTPYFLRLMRTHSGEGLAVQVLPYSYHLPPENARGLAALLTHSLGEGVELRLADALPWGGEDDMDPEPPPATAERHPPDMLLPLFALSATPQRDTHGAFLQTLRARPNGAHLRLVLIDESGLRRRYSAADAPQRLAQRRSTWHKMLADLGLAALFIDLAHPDLDAAGAPLQEALAASDKERRA
ncbi:MAG: DUF2868 domain-containing protein [Methylibium sp.]|nr:DUF2868 domain-containing protein [Methylibium sp.]